MASNKARIGFIGLGNMGAPMAANLLKAGHAVTGYDLATAALAALEATGGKAAGSAIEAASGAEIVVTMLPAGQHVRDVLMGGQGVIATLRARGEKPLIIDSSTIDVATARDAAAAAEAAGMDMVDAPVSGGVGGAVAGTLTFMVGGSEAAFARAERVLKDMGRAIVHAGGPGAGQAAKLCNNMMLGTIMGAVSEGFLLGRNLGLEVDKLFAITSTATSRCWAMTDYCPAPGPVPAAPSNRDYAPGFTAALMLKDMKLAQEAAQSSGTPTPLGAAATALYGKVAEAGEDGRDFSVIYRWLAGVAR